MRKINFLMALMAFPSIASAQMNISYDPVQVINPASEIQVGVATPAVSSSYIQPALPDVVSSSVQIVDNAIVDAGNYVSSTVSSANNVAIGTVDAAIESGANVVSREVSPVTSTVISGADGIAGVAPNYNQGFGFNERPAGAAYNGEAKTTDWVVTNVSEVMYENPAPVVVQQAPAINYTSSAVPSNAKLVGNIASSGCSIPRNLDANLYVLVDCKPVLRSEIRTSSSLKVSSAASAPAQTVITQPSAASGVKFIEKERTVVKMPERKEIVGQGSPLGYITQDFDVMYAKLRKTTRDEGVAFLNYENSTEYLGYNPSNRKNITGSKLNNNSKVISNQNIEVNQTMPMINKPKMEVNKNLGVDNAQNKVVDTNEYYSSLENKAKSKAEMFDDSGELKELSSKHVRTIERGGRTYKTYTDEFGNKRTWIVE